MNGIKSFLRSRDWLVFLLLLPCAVLIVQLQIALTNGTPWSKDLFDQYLQGALPQVFTRRCFPVWMIHAGHFFVGRWVSLHQVHTLLQVFALWSGLIALFYLARHFLVSSLPALAAVLLAAVFLPWGFLRIGHSISFPYDLWSFTFCTVALLALVKRQWWPFLGWVALGTLNKETIVYLLPAYCFLHWHPREAVFWLRACVLGLVFGLVYGVSLWLAPEASAPIPLSWHDGEHARAWLNVQELLLQGDKRILQNVYWALSIHALPLFFFRRLHPDLRRIYLAVPFFIVPLFIFGAIRELRLFNDILALGAVSVIYLLHSWEALVAESSAGDH